MCKKDPEAGARTVKKRAGAVSKDENNGGKSGAEVGARGCKSAGGSEGKITWGAMQKVGERGSGSPGHGRNKAHIIATVRGYNVRLDLEGQCAWSRQNARRHQTLKRARDS
ncbi:hypothetical protein DFH07DRAFT_773904 [Mycena maculata]|uniref:Uncharacterized protein n=1 Tax=Mycena maculata TaxID=230809 RepID=A0AAD7J218_9AGAR|nr:hypothetical protein DFH07DRAFT_775543 [Mycena maculata]KAJ7754267.1 hypothetical protein DFH07DRAFT_773904 [Mycena maculata]